MKKNRKKIALLLMTIFILNNFPINTQKVKADTEESFEPTLTVSTNSNYNPSLSWVNQPITSKQLTNYDFSGTIPVTFGGYNNNNGNGEQTVGSGYIRTNNNVGKGQSQTGLGSELPVNTSNYYFPNRIKGVFANNTKLLVSMDVLTYGGSAVTGVSVNGGRERKLTPSGIIVTQSIAAYPLSSTSTKLYVKIPVGTTIKDTNVDLGVAGVDDYYLLENYNNLPMFNIGTFNLTSTSGGYNYGYFNVKYIPTAISAGKELNYRFWKDPSPLVYKTVNTGGAWQNFNFNVDLDTTEMQYFNINDLGVYFNVYNSVKGTYALNDNLKISIANKFAVYRNGSLIESTYNNEFVDTSATDNAAPTLTSNGYSIVTVNGYPEFKWNCTSTDNGTAYTYKVGLRNAADTTNLSTSTKTYTVTSGISELRYRITTNPTDDLNDGYAVSSTNTGITSNIGSNTDMTLYLHVQAVDKKGNVSALQHIKIDMNKPTLQVTNKSKTTTKEVYTVSASDADSNLDYVLCPDGTAKTSSSFDYEFTTNGTYSFTAVDKVGNKTSKSVSVTNIGLQEAPELRLVDKGNGVQLNWSNDILPANMLWQIDFNDSTQYNLNYWNAGNGGQYITTYLGKKALYTPSTNGTGNWISSSSTIANGTTNHVFYPKANVIPSGVNLSISYRIATTGTTTMHIFTDWAYGNSFEYYSNYVKYAYPAGTTTFQLNSVTGLTVGSYITFDSSASTQTQNTNITSINTTNNTITIAQPSSEAISAVTKLKYRPPRYAIDTPYQTFTNTNGYQLYNHNFLSLSNSDIDFSSISKQLRQGWAATKATYLTDLKIGYATKTVLYRGSTRVNYGYNSEVFDSGAIDKNAPILKTSNYTASASGSSKSVNIKYTTEDVGTSYSYTLCNTSDVGVPISLWTDKDITITSGFKNMRYLVSTSQLSTLSSYTTSATGQISLSNLESKVYYLNYQLEDNKGNLSTVQSIKLDLTNPTIALEEIAEGNDKYIKYTAIGNNTISKVTLPNGTTTTELTGLYQVTENDTYTFTATDSIGNVGTNNIEIKDCDYAEFTISDQTVNFGSVGSSTTNQKYLYLKVSTSGNYDLTMGTPEDFKSSNGDIIPISSMNIKNGSVTTALTKGGTYSFASNSTKATNKYYWYYLQLANDKLIGKKATDYKAAITINLKLR